MTTQRAGALSPSLRPGSVGGPARGPEGGSGGSWAAEHPGTVTARCSPPDPQPTPGDHACGPASLGWIDPEQAPCPQNPGLGLGTREEASPGDWHWPLPRWASWTQGRAGADPSSPQGDKALVLSHTPVPAEPSTVGSWGWTEGGPPSRGPGLLPQPWCSSRQHPGPGPGGVTASGCRILTPAHDKPS